VLTDQHIAEALSRAYVRAIAGHAGLNLAVREYSFGVVRVVDANPAAPIQGTPPIELVSLFSGFCISHLL